MKNILTTCLFLCLLLTVHAADNPNVKKLFTVTSGELKLTFMVVRTIAFTNWALEMLPVK